MKYRTLGVLLPVDAEDTLHPLVIDFLAKKACISIIPAIIDYYTDQLQTESVNTGSNVETRSFPDRIKTLQAALERLTAEVNSDYYDVIAVTPLSERRRGAFPSSSIDGCEGFVTLDPRLYPRPRTAALGALHDLSRRSLWD